MSFIYGSVCSGIEAASAAWHPLGMRAAWFAEIAVFPSLVLAHRWPTVPNLGDFTKIGIDHEISGTVDVLVGGTPCQSFSVAGGRAGLDDPRGHLAVEFLRLARRLRARWLVWENVPGILSIDGGSAFRTFIELMVECGYGVAWRVLDAQHFGVPQRRARVFVVGHLGDWRPSVAVLFERPSMCADPRSCNSSREATAIASGKRVNSGVANTITAHHGRNSPEDVFALDVFAFDPQQITHKENRATVAPGRPSPTIAQESKITIAGGLRPRRLTPREVERCFGFVDDYTLVPVGRSLAKDSPRYKALGNSMAVPVLSWIGRRMLVVDGLVAARSAA